jgi:predicted Zn-ribbon and HTH transcriptional regulator
MGKELQSPTVSLPNAECKKCGYSWTPREEHPRECPNCHRRQWWKKD